MSHKVTEIFGRAIHVSVEGAGKPVVILEGGLGSTLEDWAMVQSAIGELTTTLSYDRAGLGKSDQAPAPRTAQDLVDDLAAVLDTIGLTGPFVVVGHSMGGLLVRLFAARHSADVLGMVLIDPSHEARYEAYDEVLTEDLRARNRRYLQDPARNSEQWNLPVSLEQVRESVGSFDFPLRVLARGLPDAPSSVWPSEALQKIEVNLQRRLLRLSPQSRFTVAEHSGHFIHHDQPDLVVDTIREVVEWIRCQPASGRSHSAGPSR